MTDGHINKFLDIESPQSDFGHLCWPDTLIEMPDESARLHLNHGESGLGTLSE